MQNISTNIIESLKKEPQELKEGLGSWLFRWMTLPLWPIRALLMNIIVPTAWVVMTVYAEKYMQKFINEKVASQGYSLETINYSTPSNSKCSMIIAAKNDQTPLNERKLVITFHGNGMKAFESVHSFFNSKKTKGDLLAVDYPDYATTSKELVDAGVSAVIRAIKAGYEPKNITIAGNSLGGAVSALVLKEMKKYPEVMNGQKFAGYVNHRSFTNLGDVVASHANHKDDNSLLNENKDFIKDTKKSWLGWFTNGFTSLLGVQLDAESALSTPDLPVSQMKFYADDGDEVIRHGASMAARIQDIEVPTKVKYTKKHGHNGTISNSLYNSSKPHTKWNEQKQDRKQKFAKIETKKRTENSQNTTFTSL